MEFYIASVLQCIKKNQVIKEAFTEFSPEMIME